MFANTATEEVGGFAAPWLPQQGGVPSPSRRGRNVGLGGVRWALGVRRPGCVLMRWLYKPHDDATSEVCHTKVRKPKRGVPIS